MPTPSIEYDDQLWALLRQEIRLELQKFHGEPLALFVSPTDVRLEFEQLREQLSSDVQSLSSRLTALELRPQGSGGERSDRRSSQSIWKTASDGEPNSAKHSNFSNYTNNNSLTPAATEVEVEVKEPDDDMEEILVHFEESAWSIPMVTGLVRAGRFDVVYAVALLLVNCAMQIMFASILLDEGFMGEDFENQKLNAQVWRTSVAHDYKYMDLAETSLVTRVCNGDGALILSTNQASLVEQINLYLRLSESQFVQDEFGPGTLLCMLCILLWSLCVYKEFRQIWLAVAGAMNIPRSRHTVFIEGAFQQISYGRLCGFLATNVTRVVVAAVLLVAGIMWLARTTSISELMLNAVALNAILDVDEFLFNGLTPMKFQHAIQSLSPMTIKYSRRRSEWESSIQAVTLVGTILIPYFFLVKPFGRTMVEVKELLCGGNQTFVITHNADTQLTNGLVTHDGRGGLNNLSLSEIAVNAHTFREPGLQPLYIQFGAAGTTQFETERTNTMEHLAQQMPVCIEPEILEETGQFYADDTVRPSSMMMLRSAGLTFGLQGVDNCSLLRSYCYRHDARLVRFICGQTCGCTDGASSPWYKVAAQGCAPACTRTAAAQTVCQDPEPESESMRAWMSFWNDYPAVLSDRFNVDIRTSAVWPGVSQTLDGFKTQGCTFLNVVPTDFLTGATFCHGFLELFQPLAFLCPVTCGCLQSPLPSYCPSSCALAAVTNASQS